MWHPSILWWKLYEYNDSVLCVFVCVCVTEFFIGHAHSHTILITMQTVSVSNVLAGGGKNERQA